jgi:mannan endo-1,4-beta-mannosidase
MIASAYAEEGKASDFITASGTDLMCNGKVFRYVGTNCYYLMVYAASPDTRKHVYEIFDDAQKMGVKVIRTWAFNEGKRQWNPLQSEPGSYREDTFTGLDRIIAKAKEKDMYLILTLANSLNDYGGAKQYVDWSPTAHKKTHDEFFTDVNTRKYFKDHIKTILNRKNTITGIIYKDDPTIMAWQLINEPQVESDASGETLYRWVKEMSEYIKSIDKNHLVMIGEEGFYTKKNKFDWKYNGSRGQDFLRDHSLPDVDIASFHLWPGSNQYNLSPAQVADWIKMHADDAKKLNKPLILDEFGEYRGYNGDTIERDRLYSLVYDSLDAHDAAGSNFWVLLHDDYTKYDDGYGVYYPADGATIGIIEAAIKNTHQ